MPLIECQQGTPEWLMTRTGMVTASRMGDVVAKLKTKDKESAARRQYKIEVVSELLTGRACEHYVTPAMEFGIENEPLAVAAYEMLTGEDCRETGFFVHPRIKYFGASPDRLIGTDGLLEAKCPNTSTHIEWMLAGEVPLEHQPQMLAEMACAERQWCDFVSFDPRLPKEMRLFVKRFERDEKLISILEAEVLQFLSEVDELIGRLKAMTAETQEIPTPF